MQEGSMRLKLMKGVLQGSKGRVHHGLPATLQLLQHERVTQELRAEAQGAREHFLDQSLYHLSLLAEETPKKRIKIDNTCLRLGTSNW